METVNAPAEPAISAANSQPTLHDLDGIIEESEARRKALYEIKSRGLFKKTHWTWQDYVTRRWGFSRKRAHQLMQAWLEAEMSTTLDIAKTNREARRRRQGKSTRASSKTVSLPDGIIQDLEAEIQAFEAQMSRWQKFLSNEDEILFLEKIAKIVDDRLTELCPIWLQK